MRLRRILPLSDDGNLDWARFVSKASKGSDKAPEMVSRAMFALAAGVAGERIISEATEEEFAKALASVIPDRFPFADFQSFLDALFESEYLDISMVGRLVPFAARSEYDALWKRQVSVRPHQLVHDAALDCVVRWDKRDKGALFRLFDAVGEGDSDYNSQDAVAAMLIIAVASGE